MTPQTVRARQNSLYSSKDVFLRRNPSDIILPIKSTDSSSNNSYAKNIFLNGRFVSQPITGVQRYAHEVTSEINKIAFGGKANLTVCLPANASDFKIYNYAKFRKSHFAAGYLWEQAVLPFLAKGALLNLCNLAPVLVKKQITCIHDANVFIAPQSYSRNFRAFYKTILPLIARRSQLVTTVSKFSATQISKYFGISPGKISVLPNGHEHVFKWNAKRSVLFSQVLSFRPYVLLLGSRAVHKNMSLIFGLAERLDKIGLDIRVTGSASGIFANTSSSTISANKNIIPMGHVSDDDLAVLFSNALSLAFPSITEGFGIPIIEAMALGCPVVSSNAASMPEVCGDAALLAAPDDPDLWLKHIQNLHTSKELRFQCIERGQQQVKNFSWEATAIGYLDLIHQNFS